ncbi:MAG: hypothetical protein A3I11_01990 [Elusimicrobia bacterium RIFCSPLOWO2_02_FULL_39_32]|nr:MAG: hypothetical protein A2034_01550 [Elusimicrobia bacterium GWA2_38_7]OGR78390.1 MAG: hypothetical protein A3B80_06875 [Elusimicrobia bacterium RIFCSPHIGHO2_02_FULL_39_36]OGR92149.1 MAG: hypothetical protein A3I11_01990 [Elusimicrobia bacterium RIFCSPLOWO2_02_FULL_39_32]OGR99983.1 MAG: hypothetical protein A3G85_03445 [Elusimicrobia bacterium RIFCSPLOWO2_12_FULL_39_28]
MNRNFLLFLLIFILFILGGSFILIWDRINYAAESLLTVAREDHSGKKETQLIAPSADSPQVEVAAPSNIENSTLTLIPEKEVKEITKTELPAEPAVEKPQVPDQEISGPPKKVLFQYTDAFATRVTIVGDFNNWSPQLMKKNKKNNWIITMKLKPGEYVYNFIVDGKMIRDPFNKRSKNAGQNVPSSVLKLKPSKL